LLNVYHHRLRSILILTCSVGILIWKPALSGQGDTRIPSAKGQEIPIGIGTLLSGDKAALGREVLDGAAAYLEIHPSVLGHPMTLVPMDHGCDGVPTIRAAEPFCARIPKPVAVVGYLCSPGTLAALPIHGDCRLPLLNVSSGNERLTHEESPWILSLWTCRARQGLLVSRWIRSKRIRSVLVIQDGDSTPQAIVKNFHAFLPELSSRTKARVAALDEVEGSSSEPFLGGSAPQLVYYVGRGAHLETLWGKLPSTALRSS
jgi:hypothetical protein